MDIDKISQLDAEPVFIKSTVRPKWNSFFCLKDFLFLYFYLGFLWLGFVNLPKSMAFYYEARSGLIVLGILGIWRYSWWALHVVRSLIYTYIVFPRRRYKANQIWDAGWRPQNLYFMLTTYKERRATTEMVLNSIIKECSEIRVPVQLFIGIGASSDEEMIIDLLKNRILSFPLNVTIVKQKLPGKRFAIGETLRAILNNGLELDDPVIFMDGDTMLVPGCLKNCLSFFPLFPKLQALTTFENAIVYNAPAWFKKWLEVRFIQRDFTMKSYALSNKVLTLTGRMSIFRGKHLLEPGFIDIVENDHLTHWLWGTYRFLSGDDKSTWYYLLKSKAEMFYIPDATTTTIEYIDRNPFDRMKENLRRWSGNTLRNGARAISLGPHRIGFFIWWCLVDQRISMWNMPIGMTIILILSIIKTPAILLAYILWIAFSRLFLSSILFFYARRIDMAYPFIVYLNQLMSSFIKIYISFRLPQQRWKNRGDQKTGFEMDKNLRWRLWVANGLTGLYCLFFFFLILIYLDLISFPTLADIKAVLSI